MLKKLPLLAVGLLLFQNAQATVTLPNYDACQRPPAQPKAGDSVSRSKKPGHKPIRRLEKNTIDNSQALPKNVEQCVQMDMHNKINWETLPETHRTAWVQHVTNFYPPNTISPQEAAELAREEYHDAEALLPVAEVCEAE